MMQLKKSFGSTAMPDGKTRNAIKKIPAAEYIPEESVLYLLRHALSLCTREIERQLEPKGLTSAQWAPLLKLFMGHASTVGELARECEQDAGAMTRLLDRLEVKGLCQRDRSVKDRRTVNIGLTARGREIAGGIPAALGRAQSAQLTGFSGQEVDALKGMLRRIIQNAQE